MATSSRQSNLFGINDWKSLYQTYSSADFQSYDYETIRKGFVDYLRAYYPETFNDYTESSEYVALLDVMAFMAQAQSFRNDLNTRENFIDTAERRDSVIKLANLVGYNPKRNVAGQGILKITAISTTEPVRDVNNLLLNNLTILWNDPANPNWQNQFNSIINASLAGPQRIGVPANTQTILGVKTDEYNVQLPPGQLPTVPFNSTVNGSVMNFEAVSVTSVNSNSLYEVSPGNATTFNILYRNDLLGYGSPNTGFFVYFKQGTLTNYNFTITTQTMNQTVPISIQGVNNTDTWLYQVNTTTNQVTPWMQVDNIFATTAEQKKSSTKLFSVTSGTNDTVTYTFGDGVFADMPLGAFVAYVRAGNALSYSIDPSEMQSIAVSLPYQSNSGRTETLTLTLNLQLPVNTATARETIANIKERAPKSFYSQNRMVNGEDYNNFPFTLYSSIIKSKALNRSSVGVSRNYDLLDPSGKYSSTSDFADDGGLYEDINDGFVTFSASTTNDILTFLTSTLSSVLDNNRIYQYYLQNCKRYLINEASGDHTVYWNQSNYNANEATGYFYNSNGQNISVGIYSSNHAKYISQGALLGFTAPPGSYFDDNYRLIPGLPQPYNITSIWTSVSAVVGDGYNNGAGNLSNGLGPISLTNAVPQGAILSVVIPSFGNALPSDVVATCKTNIQLNQNFSLVFDNSLLATQSRWSVSTYNDSKYYIKFSSAGSNEYVVSYRSVAYYFGSVNSVRFLFDRDNIVYDPNTGLLMQDYIKILKSNTQPFVAFPFTENIQLSVVGQSLETDGYVDDFAIEISQANLTSVGTYKNPDFFLEVTGFLPGSENLQHFTFFQQLTDPNLLTRYVMIDATTVNYSYGTQADIALVKYEFPVGQLYYAVLEGNFYISVNNNTNINVIDLVLQPAGLYSVKTGRGGLYFQYKHISSDTNRIDPATTNIIDMFIVNQDYYNNYILWVQDTTGTVTEPNMPTIEELSQDYINLNNYKMLSDSIVLNSVKFKPLFGNKAQSSLQATIKVIKNSTTTASDSEIIANVLIQMNNYFDISNWDFGDVFYFSELSAYLHAQLGDQISSAVLVPNDPNLVFGDLYQIGSAPYEIFVNATQATNIQVIGALTPSALQTTKSS